MTCSDLPAFRLVVFFDAELRGGGEMNLAPVLASLPPQVEVVVVGVDRGLDDEVVDWLADQCGPGTERHHVPPVFGVRDVAGLRRTWRLFGDLRPDVVHFNLSQMSSCQWQVAVAVARRLPVVVVEQSPLGTWSRASTLLKRVTSARLAAHLAVGERTARIIEETGGLRPHSVEALYHGVRGVRRRVAPQPARPPVLVNIARHDRVKGLDLLLRALARVPSDVRLVQIGSGLETAALTALRDELGLAGRVEFRTLPWEERAADHLADFDVFVLPSRVEGLPVTVMEAMLAGLPIVATDVGSVREVLDDSTGVVVPPEDPAALASAIGGLLDDPHRRARLGEAARARALERFTLSATVERYCEVYGRVLAGSHRRQALRTLDPL